MVTDDVTGLRRALLHDEIVVHYQPVVDLDNLVVRAAESLARWEHPEKGLLSPGVFMQAAEQTGLMRPLTEHVLDRAIAQCAEWRRAGNEMSVTVNVSVGNLLDPELPRQVERLLSLHSLPPEALQLEITESMIMSDPEPAIATVMRLSELRVSCSMDNFGTGYSSLSSLRQLPITELKIDRSFVSRMLNDQSDLIIVRSMINLGHELELRVVAEGVGDERTLMRLARLGCDRAQGNHLGKPMPPEALNDWLVGHPACSAGEAPHTVTNLAPSPLASDGMGDRRL